MSSTPLFCEDCHEELDIAWSNGGRGTRCEPCAWLVFKEVNPHIIIPERIRGCLAQKRRKTKCGTGL